MRRRGRRQPGGLTGRALVLGTVMVLIALVLASPLQRYLQERQDLARSQAQFDLSTQRVVALEKVKAQWNDPAFVEAQARARLLYARPGDTVYVVADPSHPKADPAAAQSAPVTATSGESNWRAKAWTSLQVADASP